MPTEQPYLRPPGPRWALRGLVVVLLVGVVQLTSVRIAAACSCAMIGDAEAFEQADAVFTGSLVQRESRGDGMAVFVFDVSDVYKGAVSSQQEIVTPSDGAACGFEIRDAEPVLVFGSRESWEPNADLRPDDYWGSLCNGTRPAGQAAVPDSFGQPTDPLGVPATADGSTGDRSVPIAIGASAAIALAVAVTAWGRRRWPRR